MRLESLDDALKAIEQLSEEVYKLKTQLKLPKVERLSDVTLERVFYVFGTGSEVSDLVFKYKNIIYKIPL